MVSLPPPDTVSESIAASACAIVTCAASPVTLIPPPLLTICDGVVAGRRIDDDLSGWPSPAVVPVAARSIATCVTSVPVRSLTSDGVGAARGIELDVLDTVEVHRDVADVAEQPDAAAIGRDVDVLGGVGAVEHQRVGARLTLDRVAAIAGVPDELVIAGAHEGNVSACAARDDVIAGPTDQHVRAAAADDGVVAITPVDRQRDRRR